MRGGCHVWWPPCGHLGHLVQIPRHEADLAGSLDPLYWTVFSEAKAREAGAAALKRGRVQDVLLRVAAPGDRFYTGHEGGFPLDGIVEAADTVDAVPGVRFAGLTTFPATLFDPATGTAVATPNRGTLARAAELLRAAGRVGFQVNAPGLPPSRCWRGWPATAPRRLSQATG